MMLFVEGFDPNLELSLIPGLCGITGSPPDWKDFYTSETMTDVVFALCVWVCACVSVRAGALGLIHNWAPL